MSKTLIIVESPTKVKKIQEFLGSDYIVAASKGHIADLAKGGRFGLGIDIEHDFKPHYVLMEDKVNILDNLINLAKQCDQIILMPDADKEGEAISWHLQQRLMDVGKPIKRGTFNEIKKAKVLKGIQEAGEINLSKFHSQEARRILDRIVGFMVSPFVMNYFGKNLSAGRVQSVLTKMIIDREREIEQFKPEDFYTIQVNLTKDNKNGFITKYNGRPTDQKTADSIKNKLSTTNAKFIVSEVISDEEVKTPSPPMITSMLQRIMSKEYGMSSDRTMKAAQSIYEAGHCTYIRTDSVRCSDEALQEVRAYLTDNKLACPKKATIYKNKEATQDAHECIRPSDLSLTPDQNYAMIDADEKLVYEVIWKYFLASQMNSAIYDTLKITAHLDTDKNIEVKASGKALKSKGFLEILGIDDNSSIDIPMLAKNDILVHHGKNPVKLEKKQTQASPRFSEDKLIKELVNKGIGRPSTYADLLSKVANRNYVEKRGSVYHATDLGKKITDELSQYFTFMDYNYSSKMENLLDDIENNKIEQIDMLKTFFSAFKKELDAAYKKHNAITCEKCDGIMIIKTAKNGNRFLGCQSYPNCRNTQSLEEIKSN